MKIVVLCAYFVVLITLCLACEGPKKNEIIDCLLPLQNWKALASQLKILENKITGDCAADLQNLASCYRRRLVEEVCKGYATTEEAVDALIGGLTHLGEKNTVACLQTVGPGGAPKPPKQKKSHGGVPSSPNEDFQEKKHLPSPDQFWGSQIFTASWIIGGIAGLLSILYLFVKMHTMESQMGHMESYYEMLLRKLGLSSHEIAQFDGKLCGLDETKRSNVLEFWYAFDNETEEEFQIREMHNTNHRYFRGRGITIAIIDYGFKINHPVINGQVDINRSAQFDGEEKRVANSKNMKHKNDSHGTLCAAIAAGKSYDHFPGGVACKATLILCKASTRKETVKALNYIHRLCDKIETMVHIVSMSCGFEDHFDELKGAIDALTEKGVICVAATGNKGNHPEHSVAYPAKYNNVIAVGSHDHNWNFSGFSPHIPATPEGASSFFTSLGENILDIKRDESALKSIAEKIFGKNEAAEGTSFAAPAVAGLIACILQAKNHLNEDVQGLEDVLPILNEMTQDHDAKALYPDIYFRRVRLPQGH